MIYFQTLNRFIMKPVFNTSSYLRALFVPLLLLFALSNISAQLNCGFLSMGNPTAVSNTPNRFSIPVVLTGSDQNCFDDLIIKVQLSSLSSVSPAAYVSSGVGLVASISSPTSTTGDAGAVQFSVPAGVTAATVPNGTIAKIEFSLLPGQCLEFDFSVPVASTCAPGPTTDCDGPLIPGTYGYCNGALNVSGKLYNPVPGLYNDPLLPLTVKTVIEGIGQVTGESVYNATSQENTYVTGNLPYNSVVRNGKTYVLLAEDQDEPQPYVSEICGVSIFDILLITDLIQTDSDLTGWQRVAADADLNGSINVIDIIKIRREILGLNNASDFDLQLAFPTPDDLMALDIENQNSASAYRTNSYKYTPLTISRMYNDFAVVKLGDVSGNCTIPSSLTNDEVSLKSETSSRKMISIEALSSNISKGEAFSIKGRIEDFKSLGVLGAYIGLSKNVEIVSFSSDDVLLDGENTVVDYVNNSIKFLLTSFDFDPLKDSSGDLNLFEMRLIAKRDVELSSLFELKPSTSLENRYYELGNKKGQQLGLTTVLSSGKNSETNIEIYPNPVKETLFIRINNSLENETFDVKVLDITGREVLVARKDFVSGNNALDVSMLNTGTYIVKLSSSENEYVRKISKL